MNNPTDLTRPDVLRLHLGEMTAQELRTAQAAVRFTLSQVRQHDATTDAGAELAAWAADMEASGAVALGGGAWEWNAETPEFLFQLWRRARHAPAQDAEQATPGAGLEDTQCKACDGSGESWSKSGVGIHAIDELGDCQVCNGTGKAADVLRDERTAFERRFKVDASAGWNFARTANGAAYRQTQTNCAWAGWLERAALSGQAPAIVQPEAPLAGHWRHSNGIVCSGTLRIFRVDFDTNPADEFQAELLDWVCATLNLAQQPVHPSVPVSARPMLAADHTGMTVDYSGMFGQARQALGSRNPGIAEMLRQFQVHLEEMGRRWYAGDLAVVDELLQLYSVEEDARAALAATKQVRT